MAEMEEITHTRFGLSSTDGQNIPLKSIKVDINISGYVAEVSSSLTYFNEEKDPVEAVFTFPMDDGSAVFQFEADIDGRHIVAEIQEREQADLTYRDAIDHGKTAMLLKEDNSAGDIFSCMLGNLPPESEASLVIKYVIELPQEPDGRLRFTLPTILNPRYSPDIGCVITAEGATCVPPCKVPYEFSMTPMVQGYHKVTSVSSDQDKLSVEYGDNNIVKVSLCDDFMFDHDLCFLVQYEIPYTPHIVLEKGNPEADGLLEEDILMVSFHPDLKEVAMATSGEYIFVIDRSGSMNGDKIKNAKEALLLFLKSLPSNCFFNVVSFGSSYTLLFSTESKAYTEETLAEAVELSKTITPNMYGTEIFGPLNHVLNMEQIEGHARSVFLLTDGEVTNSKQVIGLVRNYTQNTDTRVFTLGIGEGVSTALIKGIANNGGGKAEFAGDKESGVQAKVMHLLKCAMQPSIRDVTISLNLPPRVTYITIPTEVPSLISAGERFTVYAILHGVDTKESYVASSIIMKGERNGVPVSYNMTFTLCKGDSICESAPVHRLATKTQIKLMQDKELYACLFYYDKPGDYRQKIIDVSRHGNVMSKYTSFVAIDTGGRQVQNKSQTRSCPVPMATMAYLDGMYDAKLIKQGVTERNRFSAAERARSVQCMKLKKDKGSLYEELRKNSSSGSRRKKRFSFHIKMPKLSGLFSKWRKNKKSVSDNSLGAKAAEPCTDNDEFEEPVNSRATDGKPTDDEMMSVIELQMINGQWEFSDLLLKILNVSVEDVDSINVSSDPGVICTVIVVCWLRKQFSHRKDKWQMIETKAVTWLHSQKLFAPTEDIIQQITQKLWPQSTCHED